MENFHKRSGITDKGKEYENVTIANIVIQLVRNDKIKNFLISANDGDFGAFDDIVVEINLDSGSEVKAIQLKHSDRKALSIQHLTRKSGDFSILKYFNSFQEIQHRAQEFILFTNLKFNVQDNTTFQLEGEKFFVKPCPSHGGLNISQNKNSCYKFHILEDEWTKQNPLEIRQYRQFFGMFYLYTDQDNLHRLEKTTMVMFIETYTSDEEIFQKYLKLISEWNMQEGTKEKLNKKWMQRVIALNLLSSHIEPLTVGLVNRKMKIFRKAISFFNITVFKNTAYEVVKTLWGDYGEENYDFKEVNMMRTNYRLSSSHINSINTLEPKLVMQLLWLLNKGPLVIRDNVNLEKAIQLCPDQNFVVLGDGTTKDWMKSYSTFQNLSDLKLKSESYEKVMQNFTISLQGKKELNLVTAFGKNEDILKYVTTNILLEMVDGPRYIDGNKETLPEPYIQRYLSRNVIDIKYLEKVPETTAIILDCQDNFEQVKNKLTNYKLIDIDDFSLTIDKSFFVTILYTSNHKCGDNEFEKICFNNPKVENVHYFKILDDQNLEWLRSKGDVSDLENFNLSKDYFKEENALWSSSFDNNINLIIADPGMGKTELMKSFKNKCFADYWVIIINPKDVHLFFKNLNIDAKSNYLDMFEKFIVDEKYKFHENFEQEIFKTCLENNKVLYVWEALDEISSQHLDALTNVVLQLSEKSFTQFVTSRQHLKKFLEKKFAVLAININQFNEQEQDHFIRKRLECYNSTNQIDKTIKKIKSSFVIIEHIDILGIPLQIFMLTELFRQNNDKYLELLNNTFLLTELYYYFIEEKINIFYGNKVSLDPQNRYLESIADHQKRKTLKLYEKLAFIVLFTDEILQRLSIDCQKCVQKFSKNMTSFGLIVEITNNLPHFLHSSFAEYFVALYFSKNFDDIPADIFFREKYTNVRFFFDMLLAKNSPLHIAVLYRNFDLLKNYDDETLKRKDGGGRSALHLISSWGQRHPRIILLYENHPVIDHNDNFSDNAETAEYLEAVTYLRTKCDNSERDTLLSMTPLTYALKTESLGAELKLLQAKKFNLKYPFSNSERINILYYGVLLGYNEITELFDNEILGSFDDEVNFLIRDFGRTPLMLACEFGHMSIVEFLVKSDVNINRADNGEMTSLHFASAAGHEKIAEFLLKSGAKINCPTINGVTPLHLACLEGHKKIVELLVDSGAEINSATTNGCTPLYAACLKAHDDVVDYLLKSGAETNLPEENGVTPLWLASRKGYKIIVEYLVQFGAETNLPDIRGMTPLYAASDKGQDEIVEVLLKAGVEINRADNDGETPLYKASERGHEKIVGYLVKSGAAINRPDSKGITPLHVACSEGHENIVEQLLKFDAAINSTATDGCTPLYLASVNGHKKTVEYLVQSGAEINRADNNGTTTLHVASAENGNEKIVEYLVKSGAEVNRVNNDGMTPLHVACIKGYEKTVEQLVKFGAEINNAAPGCTPLYTASLYGQEKVVECLLQLGAEIDLSEKNGVTPLWIASRKGYKRVVEYLVTFGAKINLVDNRGMTPLSAACSKGHHTVVEYLVESGAEINLGADIDNDCTPLFVASQNGYEGIVDYLVECGAEMKKEHAKDAECLVKSEFEINSDTETEYASVKDDEEAVEYLMVPETSSESSRSKWYDIPLLRFLKRIRKKKSKTYT